MLLLLFYFAVYYPFSLTKPISSLGSGNKHQACYDFSRQWVGFYISGVSNQMFPSWHAWPFWRPFSWETSVGGRSKTPRRTGRGQISTLSYGYIGSLSGGAQCKPHFSLCETRTLVTVRDPHSWYFAPYPSHEHIWNRMPIHSSGSQLSLVTGEFTLLSRDPRCQAQFNKLHSLS